MLTMQEYVALRDQYKGHSVGTKFRKLIGRYDPNRGSLEELNEQIAAYIAGGQDGQLRAVHDAIDALARTPKVEKYGAFLAELLLLIPPRPAATVPPRPAKAGAAAGVPQPAAHELMIALREAQQESAYRMFVEGSYTSGGDSSLTPPSVAWKKNAIRSMTDMLKAWTEQGKNVLTEATETNGDNPRLVTAAERARNRAMLQTIGRKVVAGEKVPPPTHTADILSGQGRRGLEVGVDVTDGIPDIYEFAAAGAGGFSGAQSFGLSDIGSGVLTSRLHTLANAPSTGLDQTTVDYFDSAIGVAFSCLDVAAGAVSEIRAAFAAYNAFKLKAMYGVVPFGNATAAVQGVRDLLNRYAAEQAAVGAANLVGGVSGLASGPVGGVVSMGIKILIRVALALHDAEQVIKARALIQQGPAWKDKSFVIKAMSEVPLFAAYYVMSASTSDLVGLLSDPHGFSWLHFKRDVEQVKPQLTFLRNMANSCQMHATWGLTPMTGWMQCLDTRWYLQAQKEAYNAYQEFKRADKTAMTGRANRLANKFGGQKPSGQAKYPSIEGNVGN
jgi:hypothetical protein